jgi:C1A family cysteine protease
LFDSVELFYVTPTLALAGNLPVFGRLASKDPRDFTMQRRSAVSPVALPTYRHWTVGAVLDQGKSPQCVAYSGKQYLVSSPIRNVLPMPESSLYRLVQQNDEWPGEGYDGTSVHALFKVFKNLGFVERYEWARDNATVSEFIRAKGPVVVGTEWFDKMLAPDAHGFVHAAGSSVGGHAYLLCGTNSVKRCPDGSIGAHRIVNSWSKSWGQNGFAWISYSDMQKLLDLDGEAAAAVEIYRPA